MGIEGGVNPEMDGFDERSAEEDSIEALDSEETEVVVTGKLALYEDPRLGTQLVKVNRIEDEIAWILPDITDKSVELNVPLETLRPVPKKDIPEELRRG